MKSYKKLGAGAEKAADFEGSDIADAPDELIPAVLQNPVQGNSLIRENLVVIIQNHGFRLETGHHLHPKGIAEPIGIACVIDMAVHIQIRVDRLEGGDKFFALDHSDHSGKIHRDAEIPVIRDQTGDIAGGQHFPGLNIHDDPEGACFTDHLTACISNHVIPREKPAANRHREGGNRNSFTNGRVAGHVEFHACEDPDRAVQLQQVIPAAAEEIAVGSGNFLE